MIELDLRDSTQQELKKHLRITEMLLSNVAAELSGPVKHANIFLLPDLGLPRGVARIHGGFFNGAVYSWDSSVPFIPVDATVNCCGISAFRLRDPIITEREFFAKISAAKQRISDTCYVWNFNTGNHFISYGEVSGGIGLRDGMYAVLHSSAAEFKRQYNGLYPRKGNWFASEIATLQDTASCRYIRYVEGRIAERFFAASKMLEEFNKTRHQIIAGLIFGEDQLAEEILNVQHYGMPTPDSVAIGCHWLLAEGVYLLLTNEQSDLYFINAASGGNNTVTLGGHDHILVPHGLGNVCLGDGQLHYRQNGLCIGGREYERTQILEFGRDIAVRDESSLGLGSTDALVHEILRICPGEIIGLMKQVYNYNRDFAI